ncbi:hypothetical protein L9F63_010883 [Diploptera punctata]|uniref:Uncharacterized protein n=1 Tax=Diploptera punctata TaxID=6984 RepID=A0AAD8EQK0_DIPPU|nr:hypothetical protein L9F63_010883 [Diploptera punctata]
MEICETEKRRRRRKQRVLKALKKNSMEFCNHTSLHGLQYLGEPNRPPVERFFWLIIFITSLIIVTLVTYNVWKKWHYSPVFVSFGDAMKPVWEIPFPAITICPQIKVKQTKFNFSHVCELTNKTEKHVERLHNYSLRCFCILDGCNATLNSPIDRDVRESSTRMNEFLEEVAPTVKEVIEVCRWRGINEKCEEIFKPVITDDGLCYAANVLNVDEIFNNDTVQSDWNILHHRETKYWTFENQYSDSESGDAYPVRALTSGTSGGLLLLISLHKEDVDPLCSASVYGVKRTVLNKICPADYPAAVQDQYFRIPVNRDVVVGIKPRIMTTGNNLRSYSPIYRKCYFANERHLRYFKIYTQQNCILECFSNYTLKQCKCVAYYMPRTKDIPMCNIRKMNCTEQTKVKFIADDSGMEKCRCLPSCTEIKYDIETSQAMFRSDKLSNAMGVENTEQHRESVSMVSIFYKDNQFVTNYRSELYGTADFLASCGGLLGLYLGFSFLSLIEIIYFFTLRLISNFQANRRSSN